jgi:hypothetical protein
MTDSGEYVCNELVRISSQCAIVTVCKNGLAYLATWECSCGANGGDVIKSTTIADAIERGSESYKAHCAANHRLSGFSLP